MQTVNCFIVLFAVIVSASLTTASHSTSHPIPLNEFADYVNNVTDSEEGFTKEFESVPKRQLRPWNYALENLQKHRFPSEDLLTYDHTRVVLETIKGDPSSDFINANWIDSFNDSNRYIATQCPLWATVNDFWRMVWQVNAHQIIMLSPYHDFQMVSVFIM